MSFFDGPHVILTPEDCLAVLPALMDGQRQLREELARVDDLIAEISQVSKAVLSNIDAEIERLRDG